MRSRFKELIGLDFEYHAVDGAIRNLICACATSTSGQTWRWWLRDGDALSLDPQRFRDWFTATARRDDVCFVAHALELAESRCLSMLFGGVDSVPRAHWRCTYHDAKLVTNSFSGSKLPSCSLVNVCRVFLGKEIDTAVKSLMRGYCINDETDGVEQEIMAYCLEDTAYLPQLAEKLLGVYRFNYNDAIAPRADMKRPLEDCEQMLLDMAEKIWDFRRIAERGLPVNVERAERLRRYAPTLIYEEQRAFVERYPDTFTITGMDAKRNTAVCQRYLAEAIRAAGMSFYPRTPSGKYSMSADTIAKYFDQKGTFPRDYVHLINIQSQLGGVAGSWLDSLDTRKGVIDYKSLEPFGTATGRCAAKPSRGFVFGWSKWMYGILEPPKGKWLVELDFSAEETAIMARITGDQSYTDVYRAKDTYLWFCNRLGQLERGDFESMDVGSLKEKYADKRKKMKVFTLAWGYGAGAGKLAKLAEIPRETADKWRDGLDNRIFARSKRYKDNLCARLKPLGSSSCMSMARVSGMTLPDGWMCRSRNYEKLDFNRKFQQQSVINWFFQGFGTYILRELVHKLAEVERSNPLRVLATIHDAVFFEVDEGDTQTIEDVARVMRETADDCMCVPRGEQPFIRVGAPEIIRHGEIWAPSEKDVKKFKEVLGYEA